MTTDNLKNFPAPSLPVGYTHIEVLGARVHNLKNIDVKLPRNQLVVITGLSGSGKSSLAFHTIHAEGQWRYIKTFASYAQPLMGELERPDVDKINGLSPVIAIEQKTTSRNPRSTVGTTTEIYDYLRVLFSKVADAYSYTSGHKMVKQNEQQIADHLFKTFLGKKITLFSPVVKGRKGHYRELFEQIRSAGFTKVRVDGTVTDLRPNMQADRYKIHNIEILIDRIVIEENEKERLNQSLITALKNGKNLVLVQEESSKKIWYFSTSFTDPMTGLSYEEPAPNTFSFNTPYGACPFCEGLGIITEINEYTVISDPDLTIPEGAIITLDRNNAPLMHQIENLFNKYRIPFNTPINQLPSSLLDEIFYGEHPPTSSKIKKPNRPLFTGVIASFFRRGNAKKDETTQADITPVCPQCQGARLKKESLYFRLGEKNIAELAAMNLPALSAYLDTTFAQFDKRKQQIAQEAIQEIQKRIHFLLQVGIDYLSLDRPLHSLSGGEAQRIRLATQIGSQLIGVLYILDEPSIGLHQRDNIKLIKALQALRDLGNSIIVIEHDRDIMLAADYLVDIGPGAGKKGGEVVAAGPTADFLLQPSVTSDFLQGKRYITVPPTKRVGNGKFLTIKGCRGHNLKNIDLHLPLGKFICITGVSGSGKSTLIDETLYPILQRHLYRGHTVPLPYDKLEGLEHVDHVIAIDQQPIGRTPRSNPSTYTQVFGVIRNLFTQLPSAKIRGYQAGQFSFNVRGGRCETCQGGGVRTIEMGFLPDVYVTCEDCQGKRYNRETLEVHYKGKSIADVLDMTIQYALDFFEKHPPIRRILKVLDEVGLGYLTLGQPATTLSGGEAQRVKLATELAKRSTGNTLYILDEPTTGLHFQDIQLLLTILHRLADQGNTILVIEHNLDIIKASDHIIDMGPEGGEAGGYIIAEGTPEEVAQHPVSHTAPFLKTCL